MELVKKGTLYPALSSPTYAWAFHKMQINRCEGERGGERERMCMCVFVLMTKHHKYINKVTYRRVYSGFWFQRVGIHSDG